MYEALRQEITTFEKRTPGSLKAHQRALHSLPLGVGSNFRIYDPYPIFVRDALGGRLHDVDGNEYLDFNLCFGALMAGHCHPAVVRAAEARLKTGTMFGMPHELEAELAEEICARFPVDQVRFGNSGTEATMHAIRLARGVTGRDRIIKLEGGYHGVHDSVMVSVKPKAPQFGDPESPTPVAASAGVPAATVQNTLVASFNNLPAVERLFQRHPKDVAALILEPIMMNVGICMPEEGYLAGLRELCTRYGALLIFDEVKTGAKLARGGACEYFGVTPDLICLAKSIGGGFPLAAYAARKEVMDPIAQHKVFHAGTYNTNPLVMAVGIATFREVLTPAAYEHINWLNKRLVDGHNRIIKKEGVAAYCIGAGANGAVMLYPKTVRNYRDWLAIDVDLWKHYWFGMVNRGVLCQAHWWDEQWTISVAHTEADIDRHLEAFAEVAPALAHAQHERAAVGAAH
ncbi:MAG TPA: glutamate-1-semialdehyde 2,1-aminomutase [Terriglobia bacterium]|nr:glutamate-1-semialdehyde 2,1-aminomutase [Terriglobia bacterium]